MLEDEPEALATVAQAKIHRLRFRREITKG